MRVWLRLTCLFGLPDDEHPDDLIAASLGPILRAAERDLVEAPLPLHFQRLLDDLRRRQPLQRPRINGTVKRPERVTQPPLISAVRELAIALHP